jgi:hypothetical protein
MWTAEICSLPPKMLVLMRTQAVIVAMVAAAGVATEQGRWQWVRAESCENESDMGKREDWYCWRWC